MSTEALANRREHILNIAQKLFSRFGPHKTTIEDIANNLRMGKASIYYYFANKEDIYKEVIQREGLTVRNRIQAAVNSRISPQDKMLTHVLTRMECLKELVNYNDVLKEEYRKSYAFIDEIRREFETFERQLIEDILNQGVRENIFQIEDMTLTAEAIQAAIRGFEYRWTFDDPVETIQVNARVLLNLLLKGIEKRA